MVFKALSAIGKYMDVRPQAGDTDCSLIKLESVNDRFAPLFA
ncbi:hypothetical protein [Dysgonomonas sp. HDW5B]|nr:hypothetical protein [Dysgonomonas sp. HDW5B]